MSVFNCGSIPVAGLPGGPFQRLWDGPSEAGVAGPEARREVTCESHHPGWLGTLCPVCPGEAVLEWLGRVSLPTARQGGPERGPPACRWHRRAEGPHSWRPSLTHPRRGGRCLCVLAACSQGSGLISIMSPAMSQWGPPLCPTHPPTPIPL